MVETADYRWIAQECPICERPPTVRLGRRGGTAHRAGKGVACEVWRCGDCGLIFPHPMPVPCGGLDQHYATDAAEYFIHHDAAQKEADAVRLLARAFDLVPQRGRLLDIGCGRGELLAAALKGGWDPVGLEPSPPFARAARERSAAPVRETTLEQKSFPAESFEVVILSAVLEHLYEPAQTIAEVSRILRPGGLLFLDVPNEASAYHRMGNLYYRLRGRDWVVNLAPTFEPFHTFGFGPRSLRRLLGRYGLEPVDWHLYTGASLLPTQGRAVGWLEQQAAALMTWVSHRAGLGTYIETWAQKQ